MEKLKKLKMETSLTAPRNTTKIIIMKKNHVEFIYFFENF